MNLALQSPANRRRACTLPTRSTRALVYAGDRCTFKLILRTGRRRAPEASGHSTAAEGESYTAVQRSNLPEAEEDVAVTDPLLLPRSYFMSIVEGHNGRLSVCHFSQQQVGGSVVAVR